MWLLFSINEGYGECLGFMYAFLMWLFFSMNGGYRNISGYG